MYKDFFFVVLNNRWKINELDKSAGQTSVLPTFTSDQKGYCSKAG